MWDTGIRPVLNAPETKGAKIWRCRKFSSIRYILTTIVNKWLEELLFIQHLYTSRLQSEIYNIEFYFYTFFTIVLIPRNLCHGSTSFREMNGFKVFNRWKTRWTIQNHASSMLYVLINKYIVTWIHVVQYLLFL